MNSYSQQKEVTCANCRKVFTINEWLIVDISEYPDLCGKLEAGSLHDFCCPHCGTKYPSDAPLLIYHAYAVSQLIFSPVEGTSETQKQEQFAQLGELLCERLERQKINWLPRGAVEVPRKSLANALKDQLQVPPEFLDDIREIQQTMARYNESGDLSALNQAVKLWKRILGELDSPSISIHFRKSALDDAGGALYERYKSMRQPDDLAGAIASWREAIKLAQLNSPEIASSLSNLGLALREQWRNTGDLDKLVASIQYFEQAVSVTPLDSSNCSIYLNNWGMGLRDRYLCTGNPDDLNKSITTYERAIAGATIGSSARPAYFNNLGLALNDRYSTLGNLTDLESAIVACQQAVALAPPNSPDRAVYLNNLSGALIDRYDSTGNSADLDQAVTSSELAVRHTPPNSTEAARNLNGLGTALRIRFKQKGELTDLNLAIEIHNQAVRLTSPTSPEVMSRLNNLGSGLSDRFEHTGNAADLDGAIKVYEKALESTPLESKDLPRRLNNLGTSLLARYELTKNSADLDLAITVFQKSIDLSNTTAPEYPLYYNNLGIGFDSRYLQTNNLNDLEQAIKCWQQSALDSQAKMRARAYVMNNLAGGFYRLYEQRHDPALLEQAEKYWAEACEQGQMLSPEAVIVSSRSWGRTAFRRKEWTKAINAFHFGIEAVEHLYRTQLTREGKEAWLSEAQDLHTEAAYALAETGDLAQAVEILEKGRARLLAETLERNRKDLESLENMGYKDLYERYKSTVNRLAYLEREELSKKPANFDLLGEIRIERSNLDAIIKSINQIPGYENFFYTPTVGDIQLHLSERFSRLENEPLVIYLVLTAVGGMALGVHSDGIQVVWLDITSEDLEGLLLKSDGQRIVGGFIHAQMGNVPMESCLDEILTVLGEKILKPIVAIYKVLGVKFVVLIPTGRLSLFPLHAAQYQTEIGGKTLLDEFVVSYSPSAFTLERCFHTRQAIQVEPSFLGVGNPLPLPERIHPLNFARIEVEQIAIIFGEFGRVLCEREATREAVEYYMKTQAYLHFSCHGYFNLRETLSSGLLLGHNKWFTISDLFSSQPLAHVRLVVLSACQTAITEFTKLPEEAIGLPASFLQAGVPGVVGSLWPVNDLSTALLMIRFYQYHLKENLQPAQALRRAQLWLRDITHADLAELFDLYRRGADNTITRMAYETAQAHFRQQALSDPNAKPFSHPYYWAPFVFYGT